MAENHVFQASVTISIAGKEVTIKVMSHRFIVAKIYFDLTIFMACIRFMTLYLFDPTLPYLCICYICNYVNRINVIEETSDNISSKIHSLLFEQSSVD